MSEMDFDMQAAWLRRFNADAESNLKAFALRLKEAMPDLVTGHINACVMMMAERAADLIRGGSAMHAGARNAEPAAIAGAQPAAQS